MLRKPISEMTLHELVELANLGEHAQAIIRKTYSRAVEFTYYSNPNEYRPMTLSDGYQFRVRTYCNSCNQQIKHD